MGICFLVKRQIDITYLCYNGNDSPNETLSPKTVCICTHCTHNFHELKMHIWVNKTDARFSETENKKKNHEMKNKNVQVPGPLIIRGGKEKKNHK